MPGLLLLVCEPADSLGEGRLDFSSDIPSLSPHPFHLPGRESHTDLDFSVFLYGAGWTSGTLALSAVRHGYSFLLCPSVEGLLCDLGHSDFCDEFTDARDIEGV